MIGSQILVEKRLVVTTDLLVGKSHIRGLVRLPELAHHMSLIRLLPRQVSVNSSSTSHMLNLYSEMAAPTRPGTVRNRSLSIPAQIF